MKTNFLSGSIVDTNTQYTQNRYEEIKNNHCLTEKLTVWRNDQANSQIALISYESPLHAISIEISDLFDEKKNMIAKENVSATFVKSTKAYNGDFLGYGDSKRKVPAATQENRSESSDILYQTTPINLNPYSLQPIWIQIKIPENTKPGMYTLILKVTAGKITTPLIFTYKLEVLDLLLPKVESFSESFDIEMWQYPYSSAEYYGVIPFSKKHFSILKPIMEKYRSIGGNTITTSIVEDAWSGQTYSENEVHYPSMIKWVKKPDGSFTYDYSNFDLWVQFNRQLGIGKKIVLYSLAPWHNSFTYWDSGILIKEPFIEGSKRYKEVWTDFFHQLINHLMEKNWFEDSYIGIDERGFTTDAFNLIQSIKNIHQCPLKTTGAMDHFIDQWDLALQIDHLSIGDTAATAHPEEFSKLIELRRKKKLKTTLYSCTEHQPGNFSLSAPVESYWSVINAGKETEGFLRWAYDAWVKDPLNDVTHNAFEPGDVFFIFPDKKEASHPIVHSSIRLERMAEGVRDINKLKWLLNKKPDFQEKVTKIYTHLEFPVKIDQSYLSQSAVDNLSEKMCYFKRELNVLSRLYLTL